MKKDWVKLYGLIAVIVVLSTILIIAVPKISNSINNNKKATLKGINVNNSDEEKNSSNINEVNDKVEEVINEETKKDDSNESDESKNKPEEKNKNDVKKK